MDKDKLRNEMKKLRADISDKERAEGNKSIYEKILSLEIVKNAEWIYSFVSYGTEVDTIKIINDILAAGSKKVAVPRVCGKEMEFYRISSVNDLVPGYQGILEPAGDNPVGICDGVMLMPGLVFDISLGRIGYGGGYYDKYLEKHKSDNITKIAIAYDFQVLKEELSIDMDNHDVRPDMVITDKKIYL